MLPDDLDYEAEFSVSVSGHGKTADERLDDLEILVAHQAETIDELNSVVTAQADVISDLRRKLDVMTRRLAVTEMQISDLSPVDKPPHW
ncbi:MAG: SlyX family protein [Pseudomonadota bacterium]